MIPPVSSSFSLVFFNKQNFQTKLCIFYSLFVLTSLSSNDGFFFFTPYSGVSVECAVSNFRVSEFIDVEVNGWNKIFLSALDMFEGILASHIYIRGNSHDVEFHN